MFTNFTICIISWLINFYLYSGFYFAAFLYFTLLSVKYFCISNYLLVFKYGAHLNYLAIVWAFVVFILSNIGRIREGFSSRLILYHCWQIPLNALFDILWFMKFFGCASSEQNLILALYYLRGLFPLILLDVPFPNIV